MHQQPGDRSCSNPAIGGNHYGPVMVYMAKVSDAKTADGSQASFFKVAEDGYTGTTASWGTEILNANCGKRAFTGTISLPPSNTSENRRLTISQSLRASHPETTWSEPKQLPFTPAQDSPNRMSLASRLASLVVVPQTQQASSSPGHTRPATPCSRPLYTTPTSSIPVWDPPFTLVEHVATGRRSGQPHDE